MSQRLPDGIRRMLRLGSVDRDLDEELASYFEHTIEELVSQGHTRESAQQQALQRFGDRAAYRKQLRSIDLGTSRRRRWSDRFDALNQSIGYAMRSLARSPALSLGIVLTFAMGIGANAIMYGIVDRLFLSAPAHITQPDQVKRLYVSYYAATAGKQIFNSRISYPEYRELQQARSFEAIAGFSTREVVVGRADSGEEGVAMWATGNFFDLLGVRALRGRFFTPAEDRVGGDQVAVISYGYWQRKYSGSNEAIGQSLDFGYGPYTIVGVAPRGFTGPELGRVDFWVPLHVVQAQQTQGNGWEHERSWSWFKTVARLKPGVTEAAAAAEATMLNAAGWQSEIAKGNYGTDPGVAVAPIQNARGPEAPAENVVAKLLLGVSLLVLLIACVNVANLILARTIRQTREIAVRLSLGISRRRLVGQIVLEGVLLSTAGGIAAIAIYTWGGDVIRRTLLPDVAWDDVGRTSNVFLVIMGLGVVSGITAALMPAMRAARGELGTVLRQSSAGGLTRGTVRMRTGLALLQTGLSVVLLVGAGLFLRSLNQINQLELGFDARGLYHIMPRTGPEGLGPDRTRILLTAAERVRQLPGVSAAAVSQIYPFIMSQRSMPRAEGVASLREPSSGAPIIQQVGPGYFDAMGLRVIGGRPIGEIDSEGAPRVALVNASLGRWIWGQENPIGKCLYVGPPGESRCSEVVGIVEDAVHAEIGADPPMQYYVPVVQQQIPGSAPNVLVVRVHNRTPEIERALASEVVATNARIRYAPVVAMQDRLDAETRSWRLGAMMFSIFGGLALLVAALGLYSVLAFDVAQRTREIGVRAALGATRGRMLAMVVTRAVFVTAAGIGIGAIAALFLGSQVQPLLFQLDAHDPVTFGGVALLLFVVAVLAGLIPGWRAARVDPASALRS